MSTSTLDPVYAPPVGRPRAAPPLLSAQEVCDQTGLTYRKLDYWIRCGVLGDERRDELTRGSGSRRRFTPAEGRALGVCADLATILDEPLTETLASAFVVAHQPDLFTRAPVDGGCWLVITGDDIRVEVDPGPLADALAHGGVVVRLDEVE